LAYRGGAASTSATYRQACQAAVVQPSVSYLLAGLLRDFCPRPLILCSELTVPSSDQEWLLVAVSHSTASRWSGRGTSGSRYVICIRHDILQSSATARRRRPALHKKPSGEETPCRLFFFLEYHVRFSCILKASCARRFDRSQDSKAVYIVCSSAMTDAGPHDT